MDMIARARKADLLAGAIAVLALAIPIFGGGPYPIGLIGILVFLLACIWFGEAMGDFAGGARINKSSAGPVVQFVGWLFLLLITGAIGYAYLG